MGILQGSTFLRASNPDLIQNYFLLKRLFRFFGICDKCRELASYEAKFCSCIPAAYLPTKSREKEEIEEESPLSLHLIPPLISSSSWLEMEREIHSLSQFFILPLISSLSWLSLFLSRSLRLPFVPFPLIPDSRIQPYVLPCSRNVNGWFITN